MTHQFPLDRLRRFINETEREANTLNNPHLIDNSQVRTDLGELIQLLRRIQQHL